MKYGDLCTKIITYTAVFVLGYYLGGGCDTPVDTQEERMSRIEKRVEQYQGRLENLESKIKKP